jgi:hypothetical protein
MRADPLINHVREWFANASDEEISDFLENGLWDLIEDLESDDFFGTEGLNKRLG